MSVCGHTVATGAPSRSLEGSPPCSTEVAPTLWPPTPPRQAGCSRPSSGCVRRRTVPRSQSILPRHSAQHAKTELRDMAPIPSHADRRPLVHRRLPLLQRKLVAPMPARTEVQRIWSVARALHGHNNHYPRCSRHCQHLRRRIEISRTLAPSACAHEQSAAPGFASLVTCWRRHRLELARCVARALTDSRPPWCYCATADRE